MTVAYLPPVSRSHAHVGDALTREAVLEGPPLARTRAASRWHLVRSAYDFLDHHGEIRRITSYWCGASAGRSPVFVEEAPPGEPICGTCWGRREGFNPDNPDLLFTPHLNPPKLCPGSTTMWVTETAWNRGICLVCDEPVKLRASGGPYSSRYGAQRHAPGPRLIEGCEFHAWRELTLARGPDDKPTVACRCKCIERTP